MKLIVLLMIFVLWPALAVLGAWYGQRQANSWYPRFTKPWYKDSVCLSVLGFNALLGIFLYFAVLDEGL